MTAEPNIDRLVEAVIAGDRDSYREVIMLCEAKVRVVLAAILPDPSGVDDLAQEVFVTAFTKLECYELRTDFEMWLKAIARNLALNERRRWFRNARFKDKFEAEIEHSLEAEITALADKYDAEALSALRECLGHLDQPARTVTEDYYFRGLPSEEIASQLGRKAGWVRLILFRARAALATCLQTKGVV